MITCANCGRSNFEHGVFPTTAKVAGIQFQTSAEMDRCKHCGEAYLREWTVGLFHLEIALYLARNGTRSPEALRFMRRQAGLRAADLAELLDLRPETISRQENGKGPVDRRTMEIVAAIVEDRARGTTDTIDRLRTLQAARKQAKQVVLERIGSYEEQVQKLPPGPTRQRAARALADYKSGRVERAFTELLAAGSRGRVKHRASDH
jgi:transcriptional regulator with XRE-family HTH domain